MGRAIKILSKYSTPSLKTEDSVLLSLFMRDYSRCDIPYAAWPGLSATLFSDIVVEPYSLKGPENVPNRVVGIILVLLI